MKWFYRIFTWWHGQTLNTALHTFAFRQIRRRTNSATAITVQRRLINAGSSAAGLFSPGKRRSMTRPAGIGWLINRSMFRHRRRYDARQWELAYKPNLTGTPLAWRPPGSTLALIPRPPATGDYEAWTRKAKGAAGLSRPRCPRSRLS